MVRGPRVSYEMVEYAHMYGRAILSQEVTDGKFASLGRVSFAANCNRQDRDRCIGMLASL